MTSKLTRERTQQIFLGNGPEPSASEERELSLIALAAMNSEPFAYIIQDKYERERGVDGHLSRSHVSKYVSQEDINEHEITCTPLYRHAQPAPASEPITVTDDMAYAFHHALTDSMIGADDVEEIKTGLRAVFANLTAPVVSAEYPDRLPCSVLLEPGMRFGKGIKTSTMLAALARRSVNESDMAALSPEERAEFHARIEDFKALIAQPAPVVPEEMTPEMMRSVQLNSELGAYAASNLSGAYDLFAEFWKEACRAAMLQAEPVCTCPSGDGSLRWPCSVHPGNSPVIGIDVASGPDRTVEVRYVAPPGYVMVPKEPTEVMLTASYMFAHVEATRESWAAMLAAAPQPQNAPQSIPEIIPDCWCRTCRPVVLNDMRFVVCPDCGNKRCPRANDHRNACTGSNEPGQEGSAYPDAQQEVKGE